MAEGTAAVAAPAAEKRTLKTWLTLAKGVGEAGVTGSLPALMNAVVDALGSAGVMSFEMPATPRRLWEALHKAHRRAA